MALDGKDVRQLEQEKFQKDSQGKVAINVLGKTSPSGLNIGGRITEITLSSTSWTALPSVALANRNSIAIQNNSGIEVKLNYDNTISTYTGIILLDGNERSYDITDSIVIYAKAKTGTPTIIIEEIA